MLSRNTTHKMVTYQSPVAITVKATVVQLQYSMCTQHVITVTTYITLVTSHNGYNSQHITGAYKNGYKT